MAATPSNQLAGDKRKHGVAVYIVNPADISGGGGGGGLTDTQLRASPVPVSNSTGATSAKQDTGNTSLASLDTKTPALVSGRQPVDGSGVTQPVSAASLPLPTGAATAAKQPALGTATAPSTDVLTIVPPSPSLASSSANETNRVVKASAGRLLTVTGYNAKVSSQFIQIHNATSLPADTAVPILTFIVPASSNFALDFGQVGVPLSTGIVICNSSTQATKTIGSADCFFTVTYL